MSSSRLRTSPMTNPMSSSSSIYAQSTPAYRLHGRGDASSSSPPNDILATPRDGEHLEGQGRGRGGATKGRKDANGAGRRSVRVRGSSSGGQSSPVVVGRAKAEPTPTESSFRTTLPPPFPMTRRGRPALPPRPVSSSNTSATLAVAQAHGISADQFEEAKQQVMRFLRTDAAPVVPASLDLDKGKAKQTPVIGRSQTYPNFSSTPQQPPRPLVMSTSSSIYRHPSPVVQPSVALRSRSPAVQSPRLSTSASSSTTIPQSSTFESLVEATVALSPQVAQLSIRTRPSLEQIAERAQRTRRDDDLRKEREVRQWAERDDSSSDDDAAAVLHDLVASHPTPGGLSRQREFSGPHSAARGTPFRSVPSSASLLPSPSFLDGAMYGPSTGTPSSTPRQGIMDRFLADRGIKEEPELEEDADEGEEEEEEEEEDRRRFATSEPPSSVPADVQQAAPPLPPPSPQAVDSSTNSPPPSSSRFSPSTMMMSPAPTRGHPPSVFDSPDVSRLLMSELNELNANSSRLSAKKPSPGAAVNQTLYSSPFPAAFDDASPFSSGAKAKRTHDVFSSDDPDSAKRMRWTADTVAEDGRGVSPTPSATSLRAPSFCDSSPAMSDRGSASGASRTPYLPPPAAHPASAPDFAYHGPPSSSPTSQHSSVGPPPRLHRSSPGPSASSFTFASSSRHPASAGAKAAASVVESSYTRKRAPLKRADTAPSLVGPDGSYLKPTWSYAALIGQAILSVDERKISLADIYAYIMKRHPYYKKEDSGWQNSIRHNLSLNECFIKTARTASNPGKGCLWAIAAGCDDQFADGGFTKKGAAGSGRKTKGAAKASAAARFEPNLLRAGSSSSQQASHEPSQAGDSSRGDSPSPSIASQTYSLNLPSQTRSFSPASYRQSPSPPPPSAPSVSRSVSFDERSLTAPVTRHVAAAAALLERREQAALPEVQARRPFLTQRRDSFSSDSSVDEPLTKRIKLEPSLAAPYVHRPTLPHAAPAAAAIIDRPRRHGTSPPAASPPTSVYHRLAGPYQPISSYNATTQNHRALALLASPEAAGIMPVHPDVYGRVLPASMLQSPSPTRNAAFLPAPHIFPGSGSRRQPANSEEKEDERPQSMISPTALVHTQSPVSSMRGGPRAPMSPLQTSEEKPSTSSDPEKKRTTASRSHLPAVAALADGVETFRTPPRLRSPSSRLQTTGGLLQAAMVTPGGRPRPWGAPRDSQYFDHTTNATPVTIKREGGDDWSPFGSRAQVAAEIEHFSMGADSVRGSGLGPTTPRLHWSPSAW